MRINYLSLFLVGMLACFTTSPASTCKALNGVTFIGNVELMDTVTNNSVGDIRPPFNLGITITDVQPKGSPQPNSNQYSIDGYITYYDNGQIAIEKDMSICVDYPKSPGRLDFVIGTNPNDDQSPQFWIEGKNIFFSPTQKNNTINVTSDGFSVLLNIGNDKKEFTANFTLHQK